MIGSIRGSLLNKEGGDFGAGAVSRTGIFHVLFASFFLTLTNTILQILSYHPHHTRSKPFRLLTQFTDNQENACIEPMT